MEKATDIDKLLIDLYEKHGTDLHIGVGSSPRVRIYGELKDLDYAILDDSDTHTLFSPLLDALAIAEINTKGQYDTARTVIYKEERLRFRVNIYKQRGSWSGVFRLLNNKIPPFSSLGLPVSLQSMHRKRQGLILVTGPTGSGKSTTLASFINIINENMHKHIITLEDPIEYIHWNRRSTVSQRQIGTDCCDFESGLRAALRQDPDVILIGEIRDYTSCDIALKSAETGHLVCSTLHTLGAAETIDRILSMYPKDARQQALSQICASFEAVISQQLLPKADGSGYIVAYEFMYKTKEIINLMREGRIWEINAYLNSEKAFNDGMRSMNSVLVELYLKNKITKEVALDYATDRKEIIDMINKHKRSQPKSPNVQVRK